MGWIELWKYLQELITLTLSSGQGNEEVQEQVPPTAVAPPKSGAESQTLTEHLCEGNIYGAPTLGSVSGDTNEALSLKCLEVKGTPVTSTVAQPHGETVQ